MGYAAVTVTNPRYTPVARPVGLAVSVMVLPTEVATSHVAVVVTPTAGVDCPGLPGKPILVSLKTTCNVPGLAPPLEVNKAVAGLASSTWLPDDVISSDTATDVFPLGVVTVMVAV